MSQSSRVKPGISASIVKNYNEDDITTITEILYSIINIITSREDIDES